MNEERQFKEELKEELERLRKRVRELEEDRDRIQETLKESEERRLLIYENSPIGMGFVNLEGALVDCNDALGTILGTPREKLRGFPMKTGLSNEAVALALARAFSGRTGAFEGDYTAVTSGKTTTLRAIFSPLFDNNGKLKGVLFLAEDSTERKAMEESLRQSENRYKAIVENQAEFVVRYLPGGILTYVNDTLCRYIGMKREDLLGKSYYPFMHPEDRDAFVRKIEALDRNNPSRVAEDRFVLPDGRVTWHRWTHQAIFDNAGKLVEYQSTGKDVTETKLAVDALHENQERLSALNANLADGMVYQINAGPDGTQREFTYLSPAVERFHGLTVDAVQRSPLLLYNQVVEEDRLLVAEREALAFAAKKKLDVDVRVRMPSGEIRWRRFTSSPRQAKEGSWLWDGIEIDITERKRAEDASSEQRILLRQIMDTASVAIFLVDKTGRISQANRRMTEMFGYTMEELIGCEYVELVHPSEREDCRKKMASGLQAIDLERRYIRKDGSEFLGQLSGARFHDLHGSDLGLIGVILDTTERMKAEKRTHSIVESIPVGMHMYRLERDGRLVFTGANRAADSILNLDNGQFIGKTIEDAFPSLKETEVPVRYRDVASTGRRWMTENIEYHEGSISGAFEVHAFQTEPNNMVAAFNDITHRKQAEDALRENEAKYRLLFDSANDGIFILDETGFLDCNRRGADMYGLRREDVIGRFPGEFAPERQPDGRLSADVAGEKIQAAMSGVPQVFEWQPTRADGSSFDVEVTLNRLDLDGKACLQAIVRDIGERRRLEQERLRTQKLESIGTLAGGIAHDFNNLLQGLFGFISMAKRTVDEKEKSLAMLEQAEKALHLSVNLTTQLLTFSKGGAPVKKRIAVRPLIETAAKFALSGSRATYRLLVGENDLSIDADEGQIGQVIQNIVLNADQSMPLGGTIDIGAQKVRAPFQETPPGLKCGDFVAISIKDSGIGIPEAFLSKVFDPYFTTKEKGSGLGLATSYSIVKNHGGLIDVKSEVGKGSVFTIYLPAVASIETEPPAKTVPPGAGRRGRILVMDDEKIVRMVAEELLLSLGHDADFAAHGAEALEKYRQAMTSGRPYDIVILDLTIRGGMGGRETMNKLREIDPAVKAVVSSGYSDDAVLSDHKQHGFLASLQKPYDLEKLHIVISNLLT